MALAGGRTVGAAYRSAAASLPTGAAWRSGGATSASCRPTTSARITGSPGRRSSTCSRSRPSAVHRVEGELGAEEAARRYDAALESVTLDLALNGIGADGHTASLFPHSPPLDEVSAERSPPSRSSTPSSRASRSPLPCSPRPACSSTWSRGLAKADAVRRAFVEEPSPATPASLVRGRRTIALLDRGAGCAAATSLSKPKGSRRCDGDQG